jgi:pyocin large subunit-like protein
VLTQHAAFSAARLTRIENYLSGAATGSTRSRDAKEALLIAKLSASAARAALDWLASIGGAGALAGITGFALAEVNFRLLSKNGVLQFQGDVHTQVGAALRTASAATTTEDVAHAKQIAEYLAEILE